VRFWLFFEQIEVQKIPPLFSTMGRLSNKILLKKLSFLGKGNRSRKQV